MDDFFERIPIKAKLIGWAILIGPLVALGLAGMIFLKPTPFARSAVMGCYIADTSPPLEINPRTIRVVGSDLNLAYEVEPAKIGYRLTVSPAYQLEPSEGGTYAFRQQRGIGYFWPLLTTNSNNPAYVREPSDFGGRFSLIASNGAEKIYSRSQSRADCMTPLALRLGHDGS